MAAKIPSPSPEKPKSPPDENPIFYKATIYAGDLDPEVTEEDLIEAFRFMGPIASVRLCRDSLTGNSLRYAYVNFFSYSHASKALACLNHTELKGKPMRLMWSQRDPLVRKTGVGNVFVKNLDSSITSAQLQDVFAKFGNILSCKVAEEDGASKGFGFVQFDSEESARSAIDSLHDTEVLGKNLFVSKFVKKSERMAFLSGELTFTNLFVKNLDEHITEEILQDTFSRFGMVSSVAIIKDETGNSKGFGFVNFQSPEAAKNAVVLLNGSLLGSKTIFVERARQKDGKRTVNGHFENTKNSNLYVKNLDPSVDNKQLKQHFKGCGKIVSSRVSKHRNGDSKGFGFVCFSTHEEAKKALKTLSGTILAGLAIHLVLDRNENRRQDQPGSFEQPSISAASSSAAVSTVPVPPVYHHLAPSIPSHGFRNEPFLNQYLRGSYFGQYPPLLQNYLNRFARTIQTSQMQMGRNADVPTLTY